VTLPAFAAERRAAAAPLLLSAGACCTATAAVDRHFLPTGRLAANPPTAVAAIDLWDRQTDRRTDAQPLRRACSACCVGSINVDWLTKACTQLRRLHRQKKQANRWP